MPHNPWLAVQPEELDLGNGNTGHELIVQYSWMRRLPNGEYVCWYPGRWQWSYNFRCWGQWWERWRWYGLRTPHWQIVGETDFDGYARGYGIWLGKWRWIPQGSEPWDLGTTLTEFESWGDYSDTGFENPWDNM